MNILCLSKNKLKFLIKNFIKVMVHIEEFKKIPSNMHYLFVDNMLFKVNENHIIQSVIDKDCDIKKFKNLIGTEIRGVPIDIDELFFNNEEVCSIFKLTGKITWVCKLKNFVETCFKTYLNGKLHGSFKSLFSVGVFENGKKIGKWHYYNYSIPYFSILTSDFLRECIKIISYNDGKPHGYGEIKNHDCSIISYGNFNKGKKIGKWTFIIHGYKYNRYVHYENGIPKTMIEIKKNKNLWGDDIELDESPYNLDEPSVIVWEKLTYMYHKNTKLIDFKEFNTRGFVKKGYSINEFKKL